MQDALKQLGHWHAREEVVTRLRDVLSVGGFV